jgi:hypothetical protein
VSWEAAAFIVLVARWFAEGPSGVLRENVRAAYGTSSDQSEFVFIAFAIAYALVLIVTAAMIAQLYFFHTMLQRKGMSTFDYVVADARKQQEREKEEGERNWKNEQERKRRKELGQTQVCRVCWVGGRKEEDCGKDKGGSGGAAVVDGGAGGAEETEGGKHSVEMGSIVVRDLEHEQGI